MLPWLEKGQNVSLRLLTVRKQNCAASVRESKCTTHAQSGNAFEHGNDGEFSARISNRGPTSYHLRHRFTGDFFWELPGKNIEGAAKHIVGGWTVGGILEFRSGFTLPVSSSTTANPGARPDILVNHAAAINGNWGTNQLQYLDPTAFALPPTDEFGVNLRPGTLSRRALYGPGFGNLDFVLQKNIFMKERHRLQFRIDFYNMFDTVNFTRVNTNARSSGLGLLTRVRASAPRAS